MEILDLLEVVVKTFERLDIPYLVTGSIASMAYGEPRLTNDIDIVAGIRERDIQALVTTFPEADFYISDAAILEAIRSKGQFNIIHPESGLKVDIMIRRESAFDDSRFSRARRFAASQSSTANFASPEDIIIKKMEYYKMGGSEKHLRDITGILKISGPIIDIDYIIDWSQRLGLNDIWSAIQKRLSNK